MKRERNVTLRPIEKNICSLKVSNNEREFAASPDAVKLVAFSDENQNRVT